MPCSITDNGFDLIAVDGSRRDVQDEVHEMLQVAAVRVQLFQRQLRHCDGTSRHGAYTNVLWQITKIHGGGGLDRILQTDVAGVKGHHCEQKAGTTMRWELRVKIANACGQELMQQQLQRTKEPTGMQ